ncbi:MAG: NAD-glutamate dehydrogenase, partial [Alphaproteobacteria bacterium]|nr:NAD-glutamate dehydrogenase [Alphaproteobacteria bacterium]
MENSVQKIVDDLSLLLKKAVPEDQADLAYDFVRHFYTNPAKETLTRMNQSDIVDGLEHLWTFFYERKAGEPKTRVYHWKPKVNNALAERIIIDIVNDNMSFSLDSLYGLLQRLGTKARLTFHPILAVERNEKAEVQSISGPTEIGKKQSLEYIIHCEIVDLVSPELIAELKASIPNMLRDVRWANEDWKDMRAKALETIEELKTYEEKGVLHSSIEEAIKFVEWIENEHYTFLGYCNYDLVDDEPENIAHRVKSESALGVLRDREISKLQTLFSGIALSSDTKKYIFDSFPIIINKTSCLSHVHRNVRMDCVGIRRYNDQGKVI